MVSCKSTRSKIFNLKNSSSWVALEQNTRITINKQVYSAYQIKYDIIKNLQRKHPSNTAVDNKFLHPLIDFAFFLPRNGSLYLKDLIFMDVT